ncbi:unnamed protein product [Prunus armeniaca]
MRGVLNVPSLSPTYFLRDRRPSNGAAVIASVFEHPITGLIPICHILTEDIRGVFRGARLLTKAYLVESTKGDMLHVRRILKPKEGRDGDLLTDSFKVEVESIGDEALFVGDNHSVSVLASNFPGCQPNSVYYTKDLLKRQHPDGRPFDMAVYNSGNETITRFYSPNCWHKGMPLAAWIFPQFNGLCWKCRDGLISSSFPHGVVAAS